MLPPPRRPFLASKARRRRGPGIATARRQWERRRRVEGWSEAQPLSVEEFARRRAMLDEIVKRRVYVEAHYAGSATVRIS